MAQRNPLQHPFQHVAHPPDRTQYFLPALEANAWLENIATLTPIAAVRPGNIIMSIRTSTDPTSTVLPLTPVPALYYVATIRRGRLLCALLADYQLEEPVPTRENPRPEPTHATPPRAGTNPNSSSRPRAPTSKCEPQDFPYLYYIY